MGGEEKVNSNGGQYKKESEKWWGQGFHGLAPR